MENKNTISMDDCWYVNCYPIDSNITTVDSGPADVVMGERNDGRRNHILCDDRWFLLSHAYNGSRFLHHALQPLQFVVNNTFYLQVLWYLVVVMTNIVFTN